MEKPLFTYEFDVRDYECDLQGIVNNAVYQHYLEHTRHKFLKHIGIDFADLHNRGTDAVLVRIELDYIYPLKSGDRFLVTLSLERHKRLKLIFYQDIFRLPDKKLILNAKAVAVCLQNGKPVVPLAIIEAFNRKKDIQLK